MYFPYPGFFNKIKQSDVFVFLDDAKYSTGYYYNRNRIKTSSGSLMLTVPLKKSSSEKLNDIEIKDDCQWAKKHLKSIVANYSKSLYFRDYIDFFEALYNRKWKKLHELNMETIRFVTNELAIDCEFYFSSDFKHIESNGTQRLVDICNLLGASEYLSGSSGRNYIQEFLFKESGIRIDYQDYVPLKYAQLWGDFIPNLSIIDLIFNMGADSKKII